MQFATAVPATDQAGKQQLALPCGALGNGTAHAGRVVGDHAEVPLEQCPSNVSCMMILDQHIPVSHWTVDTATDMLAAVDNAHPARCPPEGIGTRIDRVCQYIVHDVVGRQTPHDAPRFAMT